MPRVQSATPFDSSARETLLQILHVLSDVWLREFLSEPDEDSFGAPDVAEPIFVFVLGHLADEIRAEFGESGEGIVDVLNSKHDA